MNAMKCTKVLTPEIIKVRSDTRMEEINNPGEYALNILSSYSHFDKNHGKSDYDYVFKMINRRRKSGLNFTDSMEVVIAFLLSKNGKSKNKMFNCSMIWDWVINKGLDKKYVSSTTFNHSLNRLCIVGVLIRVGSVNGCDGNKQYKISDTVWHKGIDWYFSKSNLKIKGGIWNSLPGITTYQHFDFFNPYEVNGGSSFKTIIKKKYNIT